MITAFILITINDSDSNHDDDNEHANSNYDNNINSYILRSPGRGGAARRQSAFA